MILRRKTTPRNQKVEDAINRFFKSHKTRAIGTHGTLSGKLKPIREQGLRPSYQRGFPHGVLPTYYRMTKRTILRILRTKGKQGLYREFVSQIRANIDASESRITQLQTSSSGFWVQPPVVYLTDFGLVVGKVPADFFSRSDAPLGGIPKEKILLTLALSQQDIDYLKKIFPEFPGRYTTEFKAHLTREERQKRKKRQEQLKTGIAKIFARKIITSLLSLTK